ncbi:hypothetical protein [Flavisolibacter nicotianae]|uniref:hypothetical protein n=1 Tax=Flavisolibacter nicotianae TaxID=2364882 RepID=UPI000EB0FB5F|nr:hypothetical protein [Flavisolibacter nicotianae]
MSGALKEKKITVKFFLNQALEPATDEKGKKLYPLYLQVTYNRKNMQLKSRYGLYYKTLKEVPLELMRFEEKVLTKIIRSEATGNEEGYELKGLKRKYDLYSLSIHQTLETYLKPKLRLAVLKTGHELVQVLDFNQPRIPTKLLYEAATLLFPKFESSLPQKLRDDLQTYHLLQGLTDEPVLAYHFPTVIDWVEGSHKTQLMSLAAIKTDSDNSKKLVKLIDDAVKEVLKSLKTSS